MEKFSKEIPFLLTCAALSWALVGCGEKDSPVVPSSPKAHAAGAPVAQSLDKPADAPPPPVAQSTSGAAPAGEDEAPSPKGLSDLERLNWALQMYHIAHLSSAPLTSYEPLIAAKLIKEAPTPPPGKKFVLNGPGWEVRLESAK